MNDQHTPLPQEELSWLAWQYVSDELTAEETARFESRLAREDDLGQTAREATAKMVELSDAVALAESLHAPAKAAIGVAPAAGSHGSRSWGKSWATSSAWMAIGAAVAVAAIGLLQPALFFPGEEPATQRLPHELAGYWAALPENVEEEEFAAAEAEFDAAAEAARHLVDLGDMPEDADEPGIEGVPSWLLTALAPADVAEGEEHN